MFGSFHLSLTVLFTLSVIEDYLALEGGPPMFRQDFPYPVLLFFTYVFIFSLWYWAYTIYGKIFLIFFSY